MAEDAADNAETVDDAGTGAEPEREREDDQRRKFREALERKQRARHPDGRSGGGGGAETPHAPNPTLKRQFRRKSG